MNTSISLLSFFLLPLQIYCQTLSDSASTIHIKKPFPINIDTNSVGYMYLGKVISPGIDSGKILFTPSDSLKLIGSSDSSLVILSFEIIIAMGGTNADEYSNNGKLNRVILLDMDMASSGTYIYLQRISYKDSSGKVRVLKPLKLYR